jgi:hypothetical protein
MAIFIWNYVAGKLFFMFLRDEEESPSGDMNIFARNVLMSCGI